MTLFLEPSEDSTTWHDVPIAIREPGALNVTLPEFLGFVRSSAATVAFAYDTDGYDRLMFQAPTPNDREKRSRIYTAALAMGVFDEETRYVVVCNDSWTVLGEAARQASAAGILPSEADGKFEAYQLVIVDFWDRQLQLVSMGYESDGDDPDLKWKAALSSASSVETVEFDKPSATIGGTMADTIASSMLERESFWRIDDDDRAKYEGFYKGHWDEDDMRSQMRLSGHSFLLHLTSSIDGAHFAFHGKLREEFDEARDLLVSHLAERMSKGSE